MESSFDGFIIMIGGYRLEFQQSVINWLILCIIFSGFFIWAGKKFEKADVRKAPSGILLIVEMVCDLCQNILKDNLKEKTRHYLPLLGTLVMMMACSNLLGLLGLQPPTSNLSVNIALALMMFFMIQYNGIRKGGILARMKELATDVDYDAVEYRRRAGASGVAVDAFVRKYLSRFHYYDAGIYAVENADAVYGTDVHRNTVPACVFRYIFRTDSNLYLLYSIKLFLKRAGL